MKKTSTIELKYPIGSQVYVGLDGEDDIKALVIGASYTVGQDISYHCIWYHEGARKDEWLTEYELHTKGI